MDARTVLPLLEKKEGTLILQPLQYPPENEGGRIIPKSYCQVIPLSAGKVLPTATAYSSDQFPLKTISKAFRAVKIPTRDKNTVIARAN